MTKGLWVVLNVENVDKSLEFYKLLGLKTKRESEEGYSWGTIYAADAAGIVLWPRRQIGPNQDQPDLQAWLSGELGKGVLVTIGVPNAKKLWEKVSNLVPIDQPLNEEWGGGHSFNVVDPDGYVISLGDKFPGESTPAKKAKSAVKRTARAAKRVVAKGKGKPKRKGR